MQTLLRSEHYRLVDHEVVRSVTRRDGTEVDSSMPVVRDGFDASWPADAHFDASWLASKEPPPTSSSGNSIRVVDVFAGCGGLSFGVAEACRALGLGFDPLLAVDVDEQALEIYSANFPSAAILCRPVEEVVAPPGTGDLTQEERTLKSTLGDVDLLIGGPPCQGHSDLNNHTRWVDPKNELYLSMARFCEILRPNHVIIENVPGVTRDKSQAAQRTWDRLRELGYSVDSGVLDASILGAAQIRKRSVTLASRIIQPSIMLAQDSVAVDKRNLRWAIGDTSVGSPSIPLTTPPVPNEENRRRIDYLFDRDLHNLPDSERPDCHRLKRHSYVSMYGRLHWDRPAPTLTTGFGSMGRGRFVHPGERRLLTPHEGARIQGFPDFFSFNGAGRTTLYKVIGNAVPPKLGYAAGLHLLH